MTLVQNKDYTVKDYTNIKIHVAKAFKNMLSELT